MKLCRVGEPGLEKPAIIDKNNTIRDLSTIVSDLNPKTLNFETIDKIDAINLNDLTEIYPDIRMGPCVGNPSKFLGIGLNF